MKRKIILIAAMIFSLWIWVENPLSPGSSTLGHAAQSHPKLASGDYFSVASFPLPKYLRAGINTLIPMDFDHDGDMDFILNEAPIPPDPGPYGQGFLVALRNDGTGRFSDATKRVFHNDASSCILQFLVSDFDGDGRKDLFVPDFGNDRAPQLGEQNQIFIQTPQGRLRNETNSRLPAISDSTWGATAGDIDKDGDIDIFCCGGAPWIGLGPYLLLNDGKGYFSQKIDNLPKDLQPNPDNGTWIKCINSSLLLDVDKDGDLDLILGADVGWTGSSFPPRDWILLNDGKGQFAFAPDEYMPPRYGGEGWGTLQIISADFNQDGWPDLIMYTDNYMPNGTKLQLLLNNCDGTFRDATNNMPRIGLLGYWTRIAADLNNDGWMDYVDSDTSGPRLFLNQGNAKFVEMRDSLLSLPTNQNIDMSYPCDLDQDGDIDIFGVSNTLRGYVFQQLRPYVFSTKVLFPALLQAPANNASGLPTSLTLRWADQNKKPYPDETQYQVRFKRTGGNYKYFNVKKGRAYLRLTGLTLGATYSWNIKAVGNGKDIKDSEWAVSGNDWKFKTGS